MDSRLSNCVHNSHNSPKLSDNLLSDNSHYCVPFTHNSHNILNIYQIVSHSHTISPIVPRSHTIQAIFAIFFFLSELCQNHTQFTQLCTQLAKLCQDPTQFTQYSDNSALNCVHNSLNCAKSRHNRPNFQT